MTVDVKPTVNNASQDDEASSRRIAAECELSAIADMADAVNGLWENIRENIVCFAVERDPTNGQFGPVAGMDWLIDELRHRTRVAAATA